MAVFSVGEAGPHEPCVRALTAAKKSLERLGALNAERVAQGQPGIDMGIGLHLGEVMFGNIGTRNRLDFTIIGRSVNEASRLESLSKELHVPLLLSGAFVQAARLEGAVSLGLHQLRGVRTAQEVFTLANLKSR
jgi:adenylate cyclase